MTEEGKLAHVWGSISHCMGEQQPPASAEPAFVYGGCSLDPLLPPVRAQHDVAGADQHLTPNSLDERCWLI